MCGLVFAAGPSTATISGLAAAALASLAHRGPDGEDLLIAENVILGHRRLSIIDLSDAASQPMTSDLGNVVVFNGEIYNYLEIRADLTARGVRFSTTSDTEVLLRAYEEWGPECVRRFNGMWAFCIWEPRARRLFVSRDRFGVKPLYFAWIGESVAFASEPKALIALDPELRAPNDRKIARFLANGELYNDLESFYQRIEILPAGTHCTIDIDRPAVRPQRFWQLDLGTECLDRTDAEFAELFEDAVRLRLRSDVPVGLSLSGGVDSSSILSAMAHQSENPPMCFTATFDDPSAGEQHWAMVAASAFGAPVVPVEAVHADWLNTLESIAWHLDGPGYSPAVYPAWRIMAESRSRNVPVILEGQGADELLAGYPQYAAIEIEGLLRGFDLGGLRADVSNLAATFGAKPIAAWLLRRRLPSLFRRFRQAQSGAALLRPEFGSHVSGAAPEIQGVVGFQKASPMTQQLACDFFRDILPNLLQYGDAISMAHSVESRLPFMDFRLVEWAFGASDKTKILGGITKPTVRQYLRSRGLEQIAHRRDKQGYPTPTGDWLLKDGNSLLSELLFSSSSRISAYCDIEKARRVFRSTAFGGVKRHLAYKLVSLEMWLRQCVHGSYRREASPLSTQ